VVVGHSLGGAIASAFAFCANSAAGLRQLSADSPLLVVTEVYTFGAPGVAKEPLWNEQAGDGCFAGTRFFNADADVFDPVPWASSLLDFVHPRMAASLLYEDHFGYVVKLDIPCGSVEANTLPISDVRCRPLPADHAITRYLYRIEKVFGSPGNRQSMAPLGNSSAIMPSSNLFSGWMSHVVGTFPR